MQGGCCGPCDIPLGFTGTAAGPAATRVAGELMLQHQQQVGGVQGQPLCTFQQTPLAQWVGCARVGYERPDTVTASCQLLLTVR